MTQRSSVSLSLLLNVLLLVCAAGELGGADRHVATSQNLHVSYHLGPVLSSAIRIYMLWYGKWRPDQKSTIRDFLLSISDSSAASPSVKDWWSTATLYFDQTGDNVTRSVVIAEELSDPLCSYGMSLSPREIQLLIAGVNGGAANVRANVYLVLSSGENVKGSHAFTFPSIVGDTLPYVWVSRGGVDVDRMVSAIGHELAELATNPLGNSWYAGEDQTTPTEIVDICQSRGLYKVNGRNGKSFSLPELWNPQLNDCVGRTAVD